MANTGANGKMWPGQYLLCNVEAVIFYVQLIGVPPTEEV